MSDPDRIDDLVVLGRAAPEPIKDGRHTVCLGGYSESHGYVRLYPTQMKMQKCRRWNVISAPVERSNDDTREESYKIAGSKKDWGTLHQKITKEGRLSKSEQIQLTTKLAGDCPTHLNESHTSLGMVKPGEIHDYYLTDEEETPIQQTFAGELLKGKGDYPHKLYFEYNCDNCSVGTYHRQHAIEWDIYQYWEKNEDPHGVIDALGLNDETTHHWFFVGNQNHQRQAYIIISIIRFKEQDLREAGVRVPGQTSLQDMW